ncbi:MAG: filamentous hemagglutinin N-terminal domain-containing protein [Symplocastrum torsivum CPER-KK1]|uniref:Filamentous hemagglutinin N-terminal domain-containing protein n=1 Tax=Symplocastrum torsivum CPER-KK1 TaxID=450513 RepID=A0A951PPJ5_9CYAN|nr:filamentous hemagglutinin N-terminal domain-containing protein [Symplocastrum torsivum CPER-KK1]
MIPSHRRRCWQLGIAGCLAIGSAIAFSGTGTFAQITPDSSLGTVVTPNGTTFDITEGTPVDNTNLFHSFSSFSIPNGGIADFLSDPAIANILARVTGGSPSDIQGLIRAGGNANLFLINPNGIIFGQNAQLDIGGSFVATTANAIAFPGGGEFSLTSAVSPNNSLLTVNPSALLFNSIAAQPTNSIEIRGTLSVNENQSLLLVGGNVSPTATSTGKISIQGGTLNAPGGRVELGGLLGVGTVGLNVDGNDLRLSFPDGITRTDVSLTDGANVNVRAGGGGSIVVNAQNLNMTGGSQLQAGINSPLGLLESKAGDIEIIASDTISLDGVGSHGSSSGVFSTVEREAVGNGGDINITTESLLLTNGAVVSAETFAQGDGGSIRITASDTLSFDGLGSNGLSSGLLSGTRTPATGEGGDITVTTNVLRLANGAVLSARTWNPSSGGNITVDTNNLELSGGGQLLTTAYSSGAAGNITVNATDGITISGSDPTFNERLAQQIDPLRLDLLDQADAASGVFADTIQIPNLDPTGEGGNLRITTEELIVREGGKVAVSTEGSGDAGDLWIQADSIRLDTDARLEAETRSQKPDSPEGQGNITLLSQELVLRGGSNITTNATGTATGGNISIDTGVIAALEDSNISANAEDAFGGRVIITAQGIWGTEFREEPTPESDITATSELGSEFRGIVEINTPDVDPSRGLVNLPTAPIETEVVQACQPSEENQAQSEFVITGRGGLPPSPSEALSSDAVEVDLVTLNPSGENRSSSPVSTNPTRSIPAPLVEAQGWVINGKGEVVLAAEVPKGMPYSPWKTSIACPS